MAPPLPAAAADLPAVHPREAKVPAVARPSLAEAFAALLGQGTGIRDAFQDKTVSTTSDEVHDRSEVLTGAAYKVFCQIYNDLTQTGISEFNALRKAGHIMGVFLTRAADHTPENEMTLEDVGKLPGHRHTCEGTDPRATGARHP